MKKILGLALLAITLQASAQETRQSDKKESSKMERKGKGFQKDGMKDLNLTDAQKVQMKAIREDKNLTQEAKRAKMETVFTADQKAQLAKRKVEMQGKRNEMQAKRAEKMKTELGLTNDQAAKWKAQQEADRTKMKAIREDNTLSKDAKKEKIKALKETSKTQRKAYLTADQQAKMDNFKKDRKGKGKHKKMDKSSK